MVKRRDSMRKTDPWTYAFNKMCINIENAPVWIRNTWTIDGIQHRAAQFACAYINQWNATTPAIHFDKTGVPYINGYELKY